MIKFEPWLGETIRSVPPIDTIKGGKKRPIQFYVKETGASHVTIWSGGNSIQLPVSNTKEGKKLINLITKMITK